MNRRERTKNEKGEIQLPEVSSRQFLDSMNSEPSIRKNKSLINKKTTYQPQQEQEQSIMRRYSLQQRQSIYKFKQKTIVGNTKIKEDKPISNKSRRLVMVFIDIIGLVFFLFYCGFIQSYLSTFYLLMLLLLIHFQCFKVLKGIGMFVNPDSQEKVLQNLGEFISNYQILNTETEQGANHLTTKVEEQKLNSIGDQQPLDEVVQSDLDYRPKYWFIYTDVKKWLWVTTIIVSSSMLVVKIALVIFINLRAQQARSLMSIQNYQGLEIYFQQSSTSITIQPWQYVWIFIPNSLVVIYSTVVLCIRRVNNRVLFEDCGGYIKGRVYKFWMLLIWALLLCITCTTFSLQGYCLMFFQMAFTFRIIVSQGPNHYDKIISSALIFYLYIMMITLYFFATPLGTQINEETPYIANFIGLELLLSLFIQQQWNTGIFFYFSIFLFSLLCLVQDQTNYNERISLLKTAIQECVDYHKDYLKQKQQAESVLQDRKKKMIFANHHSTSSIDLCQLEQNRESETPDGEKSSENKEQSFLQATIEKVFSFVENLTNKIDNPLVTIRIIQVTSIIVVILQRTYFTMGLVIWLLVTGISLDIQLNLYTSILFALPSLLMNYISFYYANIPLMDVSTNNLNICDQTQDLCKKLGFFQPYLSIFRILIMNFTICAYFLLIKQIIQLKAKIKLKQIQQAQESFLQRKPTKYELIPMTTIILALILRSSYLISLFVLFWVGFYAVNIIQFIMVLLLMLFIINEQEQCVFKSKNGQGSKTNQQKMILVSFSFKYWVMIVIYVNIVILATYIYILFFKKEGDEGSVIINLIGFQSSDDYLVYIWVLFYFVQLQYDSYRSKIYLKYSSNIFDIIMKRPFMKQHFNIYQEKITMLNFIIKKGIVWQRKILKLYRISFIVNFGCLLFTPFSYLNTLLLAILTCIFLYYVSHLMFKINYKIMRRFWYVYLNLIVGGFFIKYVFQFICIPLYPDIQSINNLAIIYNNLQSNYQLYGFFIYQQSRGRIEYLPDMLNIFFGALSLSTFHLFVLCMKQDKAQTQSYKKKNKNEIPEVRSDNKIEIEKELNQKILEKKQRNEIKQTSLIMKKSILNEWKQLKRPILMIANLNTDAITLVVVMSAVFWNKSLALLFLMILYLSYYWRVHNRILNEIQVKQVAQKIAQRINQLSNCYLKMDQNQISENVNISNDLKNDLDQLTILRITTRINLKRSIWKISFYFNAACVFLTYCSQSFAGQNIGNTQFNKWAWIEALFFVLGTYAKQTQTNECFCGVLDPSQICQVTDPQQTKSNILQNVWLYVVLVILNVVDVVCTRLLMDDLKSSQHEKNLKRSEDRIQDQFLQSGISIVSPQTPGLQHAQIIEEDLNKSQDANTQQQSRLQQMTDSILIKDFLITHNYVSFEEKLEQLDQDYLLKDNDQQQLQILQYSLLLNYYGNQNIIINIVYQQGLLKVCQRLLVLMLLLNTLLVNNVFSIFYCLVSSYLFFTRFTIKSLKLLNTFSILAIIFQYLLLILNYLPNNDQIPVQLAMKPVQFSIIQSLGLTDQIWLSYLGFSGEPLENCQNLIQQQSLFQREKCESNSNLSWVFVINTLVVIFTYTYFLLVEIVAIRVLKDAVFMENNMNETKAVLQIQLKKKLKIKLNHQDWQKQIYSVKIGLYKNIYKNSHLVVIGLILILAGSNNAIFNLLEVFISISLYFLIELVFKWPYLQRRLTILMYFFKILYFIPVIAILCFTLLKMPILLQICVQQTFQSFQGQVSTNTDQSLIFYCVEVFHLEITGMIFIMFILALYFDLMNSPNHQDILQSNTNKSILKARMVSRALAYQDNHDKYKDILKVQEQKNIFKQIQTSLMVKLKSWHAKMEEQQSSSDEDKGSQKGELPKDKSLDNQMTIEQRQSIFELLASDHLYQEQNNKNPEWNIIKKILVFCIIRVEKRTSSFKFMGLANLLDYILAQNQQLQRHIYINIIDYVEDGCKQFKKELDFLEIFQECIHRKILDQKVIRPQFVDEIMIEHNIQFGNMNKSKADDVVKIKVHEQQKKFASYSDYRKSKELTFIHIYDPYDGLEVVNFKSFSQIKDFGKYSNYSLILMLLKSISKMIIGNWSTLCFIMIILYFCQNSGFTGGILPALMFAYFLVEGRVNDIYILKENYRYFWYAAYSLFFLLIILNLIVTLDGFSYPLPQLIIYNVYMPWYQPLFNSVGAGIYFEVFLLWIIAIHIHLQKKWGVYYTDLFQIESLFRGYVRMKLNNFNQEVRKELQEEIEEQNILVYSQTIDDVFGVQNQDKLVDDLALKNQNQGSDQIITNPVKAINALEQRIIDDPKLLKFNANFSFFERTFSFKFSKPGRDFYIPIFTIQLIIFLYILFFYSFLTGSGQALNNITRNNQIPGEMVLMLLVMIIVMVIERYITLLTPNNQTSKNEDESKQIDKSKRKKKQSDSTFSRKQISMVQSIRNIFIKPTINESLEQIPLSTKEETIKKKSFTSLYNIQFVLKFVFQIFLLILLYWFIFIFIGQPWVQKTSVDKTDVTVSDNDIFTSNWAVIIFFFLWSIYFYISALQLRYGYRQVKLRNTMLQNYDQFSQQAIRIFYAVPFLFELKVLMDWTFIQVIKFDNYETSLDVFQWFKLENIQQMMYQSKVQSIDYLDRKVGSTIYPFEKCGLGCSLVLFILICIFGPLILFSSLNPSTQLNLVTGGTFAIQLNNMNTGLTVPLYDTNQFYGLERTLISQGDINKAFNKSIQNPFINTAPTIGALQQFQLVSFSDTNWGISEPLYQDILHQINQTLNGMNSHRYLLNVSYVLNREAALAVPVKNYFSYPDNKILKTFDGQDLVSLSNDTLRSIYNNLAYCKNDTINLPYFYVQVAQLYTTNSLSFKIAPVISKDTVSNVTMALYCSPGLQQPIHGQSWWNFTYSGKSTNINQPGSNGLLFFIISDRYSSLTSGLSIITLYTSVILLIGSLIRGLFSGQIQLIPLKDMMKPDDILLICEAITIARSQKDFVKEHMLYFELIDILRSPEIIKAMTGSWSEAFKKKYIRDQKNKKDKEKRKKLKKD